jgi:hypothetical protein
MLSAAALGGKEDGSQLSIFAGGVIVIAKRREMGGKKRAGGNLPLKLLSSSFSALARFEFGREPASALRLRDSMRSLCLSEALAPRCSGLRVSL